MRFADVLFKESKMYRLKTIAFVLAAMSLETAVVKAQEQPVDHASKAAQADGISADGISADGISADGISVDDLQSQLREIACAQAADFANPSQSDAIRIVRERGYQNESFNAVVYNTMRTSIDPETWNYVDASKALLLLPHTTLETKVQSKLALECFLSALGQVPVLRGKAVSTRVATNLAKKAEEFLAKHPSELAENLREALKFQDLPSSAFTLIQHTGEFDQSLMPLVLEVARGDNVKAASAALQAADICLERMEANLNPGPTEKTAAVIEDKFLKYATAVIKRYDKNEDGRLTEQESSSMLMSPMKADLNGDRLVTVKEYGDYLKTRQKK
jgi:hypothetical protein